MTEIGTKIFEDVIAHAIHCYPDEACGMLLGPKTGKAVTRFVPMRNMYNAMHERDPETYPRTAKTAYLIDAKEQRQLFEAAEKSGDEIKTIFHSHTDHDAYFSDEDKLVAAPWGEPMYPGITYLVVSVRDGKFYEANEFYWEGTLPGFAERKIK